MGQPVCTYLNRRGQVIRVGVGTPNETKIPPLELPRYGAARLCGIRCIATHYSLGHYGWVLGVDSSYSPFGIMLDHIVI